MKESDNSLQVYRMSPWVFYDSDKGEEVDPNKCGKWMYFFSDLEYAAKLCRTAVTTGVVTEAKHTDEPTGVCCFYLNADDVEGHKKTIQFFLENDLIRRTKTGRLYNISFKLDEQTIAGEYGDSYQGKITLDMFMDLVTGEWKV